MKIAPTKKDTAERVTGPSNGMVPLLAVIVLTILTWGGIWTLHKKWYQDPTDPVSHTQSSESQH